MKSSPLFGRAKQRELAAAIAALYALSSPLAHATQTVTNCADAGAGSLRAAISAAVSGELVDASGLSCSLISLHTGAISFSQNDLSIKGPGTDKLTINGKYNNHTEPYRIFTHYGSGTLSIQGMKIQKGYANSVSSSREGGCIRTSGNLVLVNVEVSSCTAKASSYSPAHGGGVFVAGNMLMINSTVKYNSANGASLSATGGGVYAKGNFGAKYSTISNNTAVGATGTMIGFAGGVYARGAQTYLLGTTIANNTAGLSNGGIAVHNLSGKITIENSTISGNKSTAGTVGGLYASAANTYIDNSTIAFNTAGSATPGNAGVGAAFYGGSGTPQAVLNSTLIANNTYGATPTNKDVTVFGVTLTGSNNLIRVPDGAVPAGTIVGKCPLLGPLRNNGGTTLTHALLGHSPAIDAGNDTAGFTYDQRSSPYMRASGPPGVMMPQADIGAFEVDQSEKIFDANFEGCT